MKQTNIFLGVLTVAVAVLFYLHFSSSKKDVVVAAPKTTGTQQKIAYFNLDTLEEKFEYAKELALDFKNKNAEANSKMAAKQKDAQDKAIAIQTKVSKIDPRNPKSQEELTALENAQNELRELEMSVQQFKQDLATSTTDFSKTKLEELKNIYTEFLKDYNKNNVYSYVFSYNDAMSTVLFYKDSAYDITNDMLKVLNVKYKKK